MLKPEEYMPLLAEVRALVNKVVRRNMADGILFSAGTDTTIIAYEAVKYKPRMPALTMAFKGGNPRDTVYVKRMVDFLKLNQETHWFDGKEALVAAEKVVGVLKKFDPMEIRNSLPVYIALTIAKQKGLTSVLTGDGLDELYGYPWMWHMTDKELGQGFLDMWSEMSFSSIPMGKSLGVTAKPTYLDPEFMEFSKKLPIKLKINIENGEKYGKWILRKAYEDLVPKEVIWRPKAPLEEGTGTEVFRTYFDADISNQEFEEKKKLYLEKDDVQITNREQMLYYEFFRKRFGKPSDIYNDKTGKQCPKCKSYVKTKIQFCNVCGASPI